MFKISKKRIVFLVIFLFILVGTFLRLYHFSDWLHFELDQSRDAMVIDYALENGAGELPLLGPKAAGTYLRLGPIFYYFQYLGGILFGQTPQGIAYPTAIFSIFLIPLTYFFSRRMFGIFISLGLSSISAVSLFLVIYGRFSWNPNAIPFFLILTFYGILKGFDKNEKKRDFWIIIASFSMAIATQLHFLVFLSLPLSIFIFFLIKRPNIKMKTLALSFLMIVFCYLPVILNDIKTQGANTREFFKAITEKSSKEETHSLAEKIIRVYTESSRGVFLIITGQEQAEIPGVLMSKQNGLSIDIKCDESCRKNLHWGFIAILFSIFGFIIFAIKFIKNKNNIAVRDAILLILVWIIIIGGIFVPLAYNIAPRFFLLLVPVAIIFLGLSVDFFFDVVKIKNKKILYVIAFLFFSLIAYGNIKVILKRFNELKMASTEKVEINPDRILKERTRVTLEQEIAISDYMKSFYDKNSFIVYLNSEPQYRRAILYHLRRQLVPYEDLRVAKVYEEGNYFVAYLTNDSYDEKVSKYLDRYDELERKQFGTITISHLMPKKDFIVAKKQEIMPVIEKKKPVQGVPVRYTWKEFFNDLGQSSIEEEDEEIIE